MYPETFLAGAVGMGALLAVGIAVVRTTASMRDEMQSIDEIKREVQRTVDARPDVREVRSTRLFKQAGDRYYGEVEYMPVGSDRPAIKQLVLYKGHNGSWSWREA